MHDDRMIDADIWHGRKTTQRYGTTLSRSYRVPNNVVDRKLDELRALVPPPLALGTYVRESMLDIRDLEGPQLVFAIEMLPDQLLHLPAGRRSPSSGRYP